MARLLYGYTPSDYGVDEDASNGDALINAAVTLDIYDAPGGTQQTDLLDANGDAASQASAAAGALLTFSGPDGYDKDLYGTPDSGATWYRFPPSPNSLVDRVATLESAGSSTPDLGDLGDVSVAGATTGSVLGYNPGTTSWGPTTVTVPASIDDFADVDDTAREPGAVLIRNAGDDGYEFGEIPTAGDYAASDHAHTYQLTGVVLEQGDPLPTSPALPSGALIFRLAGASFGYGALVGTMTGTFGTTATLTVGTAQPAGTLLVVGVGWGTSDVTFSVADSASNTYTAATTRLYQGTTTGTQIFYSRLTTQLPAGGTITITSSAATNHIVGVVSSVIGSDATPLDKTATNGQSATTAPTVGPTATLASSPQIAFATTAFIPTDRSFTPASGWTLAGSASTGTRAVWLYYRTTSDTTAVTASGTITGTAVITASALATFESA